MFNLLTYFFVSGYAIIPASLMMIAGALLTIQCEKNVKRKIAAGLLFLLGSIFYIQATVMISAFIASVMLLTVGSLYFLSMFEAPPTRIFFVGGRILFIGMTIFLLWAEINRLKMPIPGPDHYKKLYVIGGKSSSGTATYVDLLKSKYHLPVFNVSSPENDIKTTMRQAELISSNDVVILFEPGLNPDYRQFAAGLEPLLKKLGGNGRTVIMFEIPRFVNDGNFRKLQDDTAQKTGTIIIPRRIMASAIYCRSNGNEELTPAAQEYLADILGPLLLPLFEKVQAKPKIN